MAVEFPEFEKTFAPVESCRPASTAVATFAARLPPELVRAWTDRGRCVYANGLLHDVDPAQFQGALSGWLDPEPADALVFLRTAFADLYFWDEGHAYALDVHRGLVSQVTDDITRLFRVLCDPRVQEKSLRRPLYDEAVKRLGPPAEDECYAFVPALVLGGPGTADSIQKVKMREHLDVLRQLVAG